MNLVIDTHTLLWWLMDSPKLTNKTTKVISSNKNHVYVSSITIWEIGIKKSIGKLDAPDNIVEAVTDSGFITLPFNLEHADLAGKLKNHHKDPFDRAIVAQCQIENLSLLSCGSTLKQYEINLVEA